jgi:hypothetical protein
LAKGSDMSNNTPNSHQDAINRANSDAAAGRSPANTTGWDTVARQNYETQLAWQKQQQQNK